MVVCANCGEQNPERFRLCGFCGTPLAAVPAQEVRKTVTIVFSDLQGSTSLGERMDAESLRDVLRRYFEEMRAALESHGGRIEKYIGDAIVAVFGLPTLHEDDALRAVRAAADSQKVLATLNEELERRWGTQLTNRTGVNTGEIVTGGPVAGQHLVVGDAVNVAARLEQAAPAFDVLIGESTYQLVRHAVDVEPVEPLVLKGKSDPVPAYRLVAVREAEAVSRRVDRPVVGREREFTSLRTEFDAAVADRTCRHVLVLGHAGIGKTRLTVEFAKHVSDDARVLRGRCLSYGRGITFWPLVEMVKQAAEIREDDPPDVAKERLLALARGNGQIADRVAAAIGLSAAPFTIDDLFWGARKLFERLAEERPLVVIVEDVHWAETTFLDFVEQLARGNGTPLLLVCVARPDFDELRPEWARRPDITRIELRPLSEADAARIIADRLGDAELGQDVQKRILQAADGNPLFVEQLLAMLIEGGRLTRKDHHWLAAVDPAEIEVPPTIQGLLAARLDLLTHEERAVIEPAAVIGTMVQRAALDELVAEEVRDSIDVQLAGLERKRLLYRVQSTLTTDVIYRFDHILVRDAAYQRLLKRTRASLHEKYVDWGERVDRDRDRAMEYEEIRGYHLEQAFRYLSELGPLDDHGVGIGTRAAEALTSAGRRAFGRNDMAAAANLLRRAVDILPDRDLRRLQLLPDLGEALTDTGELAWAELFLKEAAEAAAEIGDERLAAEAALVLLVQQAYAQKLDRWTASLLAEAERAIEIFEPLGDNAALARAWRLIMNAHGVAQRFGDAAAAAKRAGDYARKAGDSRQEARAASGYAKAALLGPTPVAEAIAHCEQVLRDSSGDKRLEGLVLCLLAPLRAMQGEFQLARELYARGRGLLEDIGGKLAAAATTFNSSRVEMLAGDAAAAERTLRREYQQLEEIGETYLRSTVAAHLAAAICSQGRYDEGERFTQVAEELATVDDVVSQALWRSARATALSATARIEQAIELAEEAVDLLAETDGLVEQADALLTLATVLGRAGRAKEAVTATADALALYERKGSTVAALRARTQLAELNAGQTTTALGL